MHEVVLLIGHGSKDPAGNEELARFAGEADARYCMLDYVEPSIPTAFALLAKEGVERVAAVPYFLFAGGHVKHDIPRIVAEQQKKYPWMEIRLGRHLGMEDKLLRVLRDRLGPVKDQAVLLVGRGSLGESDPLVEMSAGVKNFAKLYRLSDVSHCFISLSSPDLPAGIARCRAGGAASIVVVPCFLFTGVLVKRVHRISRELGAETRPHLGSHEDLIELVHERKDELWRA